MPDISAKRKIAKRPLYQKVLVLACIMVLVGGILTGIMTYINVGFRESFWMDWLSSFAIAVLVTAPSGLLFMTLISKFIERILPNGHKILQQVLTGIGMAFVMESILAVSTTANLTGFSDIAVFITTWRQSFIAALPFGLCIGLVMSIVLKPKLEKFMAS